MKTGAPVLSIVFRAVEGFPAVDAEYPVVSPDGQRIGSVSILFHPERLLGSIIAPTVQGMPVDIWVVEKEGVSFTMWICPRLAWTSLEPSFMLPIQNSSHWVVAWLRLQKEKASIRSSGE